MKYIYLLIFLFSGMQASLACSCFAFASPKIAFKHSQLVCTGQAVSIKPYDGYHEEVTFLIKTHFKGNQRKDTLTIMTESNPGYSCGVGFIIGQEYIIYSTKESFVKFLKGKNGKPHRHIHRSYYTDVCYRTTIISRAAEDLSYLNERKG